MSNVQAYFAPHEFDVPVGPIMTQLVSLAERQELGVYNFLYLVIDQLEMFAGERVSPERFFEYMYTGLKQVPRPLDQVAEKYGFAPVLIRLLQARAITREFANKFLQAAVRHEASLNPKVTVN